MMKKARFLFMGALIVLSVSLVHGFDDIDVPIVYREAVMLYLNGQNDEAITRLKRILDYDSGHKQAQKLLLKVMAVRKEKKKETKPPAKKKKSIKVKKPKPKPAPAPIAKKLPPQSIPENPVMPINYGPTPAWQLSSGTFLIASFIFMGLFNLLIFFLLDSKRRERSIREELIKLKERLKREEAEVVTYKRYYEYEKSLRTKEEEAKKIKKAMPIRLLEQPAVPPPVIPTMPPAAPVKVPVPQPAPERPRPHISEAVPSQPGDVIGVMIDVPSFGKQESREKIAEESVSLFQSFPENAIDFLSKLAHDPAPLTRASVVLALENIASPEALDLLLMLSQDMNNEVKREALKSLKKLHRSKTIPIPDAYKEKIRDVLREEVAKSEWII